MPTDAAEQRRLAFGEDGTRWEVYERHYDYDRRSGVALVFTSDSLVRRVREFPADWRSLDDRALLALSWGR